MKLLVVDGSRVMRQLVTRSARQAGLDGCTVVEGANGAEGLARALSGKPDLIVSAWHMPEMNGLQFLKALRRAGVTTPVGFVTADASPQVLSRAAAASAAFVIAKPFTGEEFEAALSAAGIIPARSGAERLLQHVPSGAPARAGCPAASTRATLWLPSRQVVRETLQTLLGRSVKVRDGDRVTLDLTTGPITVGTLVSDTGRVHGVVCADLPLTVRAGACLGVLPGKVAHTMVADKELTPMVAENFSEVLNVLCSVFNVKGPPHVRLGEVYSDPDLMPPRVLLTIKSLTRRDDLAIDVAGYGSGNLSIVLVDDSA